MVLRLLNDVMRANLNHSNFRRPSYWVCAVRIRSVYSGSNCLRDVVVWITCYECRSWKKSAFNVIDSISEYSGTLMQWILSTTPMHILTRLRNRAPGQWFQAWAVVWLNCWHDIFWIILRSYKSQYTLMRCQRTAVILRLLNTSCGYARVCRLLVARATAPMQTYLCHHDMCCADIRSAHEGRERKSSNPRGADQSHSSRSPKSSGGSVALPSGAGA